MPSVGNLNLLCETVIPDKAPKSINAWLMILSLNILQWFSQSPDFKESIAALKQSNLTELEDSKGKWLEVPHSDII